MRLYPRFLFVAFLSYSALSAAFAADIVVIGVFPNKAVLVVDGGKPRTFSAGANVMSGVRLIAVDQSGATFVINGVREKIPLGAHSNPARSDQRASATFEADRGGHYHIHGQINGLPVQMLLDTGATAIALPASEARRLGVAYHQAPVHPVRTANGVVPAYAVKLNRVRVGDIELTHIDGLVVENGLSSILLGMSFLSRTEMRHDGTRVTLTKRY